MDTALQQLMERNVMEVWGERDSARRRSAINEIYTEDCIISDFEGDEQAVGRDALSAKVDDLLKGAPDFVFGLIGPAQVIHDIGRSRWHFGPPGAAPVVIGTDVAVFEDGRIRALYVFLDEGPSDPSADSIADAQP